MNRSMKIRILYFKLSTKALISIILLHVIMQITDNIDYIKISQLNK